MPEIFGNPMSINTMSGMELPISLTTFKRLLRLATQRIPSVLLNRLSRLLRRVLLSSTMATLIMVTKDGKYFDTGQSDIYMNLEPVPDREHLFFGRGIANGDYNIY